MKATATMDGPEPFSAEDIGKHWWQILALSSAVVATITQAQRIWRVVSVVGSAIRAYFTSPSRAAAALQQIAQTIAEMRKELAHTNELVTRIGHESDKALATARIGLDHSSHAAFECSWPSGECVWTNAAMHRMFGLSFEETLGFGWLAGIRYEDQERVRKVWMESIGNFLSRTPYECRYYVENIKATVVARAKIIYGSSGIPLTIIGTVEPLPVTTTPLA